MLGSTLNLDPGSVFADDYRVVRLLAAGGMGAVYVVDQLSTGKSRALKVMRPELTDNEELRKRFQQEARIGGRIESDHVVEIHSAGVDEATRTPYIVMELLAGEDLGTRLDRAGALTPLETLNLYEQLCHAVAAAHDAGIVHRDLKPENVFLSRVKRAGEDGRVDVKVLDFGIAKLAAESATRGATTTGMIGTPLWMAPEQTERGPITPGADVWALGLILFRVLTGYHFWRSASDESATYAQILKEVVLAPIPAATVRARELGCAAAWPPTLDAVFALSVARDPAKRYRDARVFGAALREELARISPPSSGRGLAVEPSSARILAGAPMSSGLDATAALPGPGPSGGAGPAPMPALTPMPDGNAGAPYRHGGMPHPPIVEPFRPRGPALLSASLGGTTDIAGLPARAVIVGIGLLVTFASMTLAMCARRRTNRQREEAPIASMRLAPPTPPLGPTRAAPSPRCHLCTGEVVADGGLSRDGVVSTVESAFPRLDAECLERGRRKARAATVTLTFRVVDGVATHRTISATTAKDGTDECLVRALSEVAFSKREEATNVTYTLRFDPAMR